jgi:hypothetical protein
MSRVTEVLVHQHRRVIALLDQTQENPKAHVLESLADEIVGHTFAEAQLVYPNRLVSRGSQAQALEEHAVLQFALQRLLAANPGNVAFEARLRALRELVVHHLEREERARLPHVERQIGVRRSRELAERVASRFDELVARGHRSALRRRT